MSAKTTKPTARKTSSKAAKKRGNLSQNEIKPLIMAANKAFRIQSDAGNVDTGETFDTWRHAQCMEAVGKPGITACNHIDFRPLLAHFQTLAGDDAQAFRTHMRSGKPTDNAAPGDTHEARGVMVSLIAEALAGHLHLANTPAATLLAETIAVFAVYQPGMPPEAVESSPAFRQLLARKTAIAAKAPIQVGYIVYLTRQKTRRPDLTLGQNWKAGLAERCTVNQLTQIRDTLVNRIAAVEGVGSSQSRNKSQRSPKAKAARSPHQVADRNQF